MQPNAAEYGTSQKPTVTHAIPMERLSLMKYGDFSFQAIVPVWEMLATNTMHIWTQYIFPDILFTPLETTT